MVTQGKTTRAKWDSEVNRILIDIWDDNLEKFDDKKITKKTKEAIAITSLNVYVSIRSSTELSSHGEGSSQHD